MICISWKKFFCGFEGVYASMVEPLIFMLWLLIVLGANILWLDGWLLPMFLTLIDSWRVMLFSKTNYTPFKLTLTRICNLPTSVYKKIKG